MISTHPRVKAYCSEPLENIENYDKAIADDKHMWDCHHRAEILPCGIYSSEALNRVGLYWNRPASELIFLRHDEHSRLHGRNPIEGVREAKRRAMLGRKNPNAVAAMRKANLGCVRSEETRRKISESKKGQRPLLGRLLSEETRRRMSASAKARCLRNCQSPMRGRRWITNGVETRTIRTGEEIPCGWRIGRSLT